MGNTPVATNDIIAEELKRELMNNLEVREAILRQEEGFLTVFIRKGRPGKMWYKKAQYDSTSPSFEDFNFDDDEGFSNDEPIIPLQVYRRFCYSLATFIIYSEPIDYGYIDIKFRFVKNENGLWQEEIQLIFTSEVHFNNG